jgi:hypothetical protein
MDEKQEPKSCGISALCPFTFSGSENGVTYLTLNAGFKRTAAHAFYQRNGYSSGNYCFGKKL